MEWNGKTWTTSKTNPTVFNFSIDTDGGVSSPQGVASISGTMIGADGKTKQLYVKPAVTTGKVDAFIPWQIPPNVELAKPIQLDEDAGRDIRHVKPVITKGQAEAVHHALGHMLKEAIIKEHAKDRHGWKGKYFLLRDLSLGTLCACLYVGYHVKKDTRLKDEYDDVVAKANGITDLPDPMRYYFDGVAAGIRKALILTDTKVEGINE